MDGECSVNIIATFISRLSLIHILTHILLHTLQQLEAMTRPAVIGVGIIVNDKAAPTSSPSTAAVTSATAVVESTAV
jgi:hypothetical protein